MQDISRASAAWRKLNVQLHEMGLFQVFLRLIYQTCYSFYYKEFAKIILLYLLAWSSVLYTPTSLGPAAAFALHMLSALLLASTWHQGAFVAHDGILSAKLSRSFRNHAQ